MVTNFPQKVQVKRDYKLVPFCVHACQSPIYSAAVLICYSVIFHISPIAYKKGSQHKADCILKKTCLNLLSPFFFSWWENEVGKAFQMHWKYFLRLRDLNHKPTGQDRSREWRSRSLGFLVPLTLKWYMTSLQWKGFFARQMKTMRQPTFVFQPLIPNMKQTQNFKGEVTACRSTLIKFQISLSFFCLQVTRL